MDIGQLETDAAALFAEHGLDGWTLGYNNRRAFGVCNYDKRRVLLNRYYAVNSPREHVWGTVLHEVAHALTPGCGHNAVWKAVAVRIGAAPERTCADAHLLPATQYEAKCPCCTQVYRKKRKPVGRFACSKPKCQNARLTFVQVKEVSRVD